MSRVVYLNGAFVPESEAKLSIYDLSVMQSAAAFEMTRSFNGVHFKLKEHLDRLHASCKLLSIDLNDVPFGGRPEDIIEELTACNDHGPSEEHRLLIVVSPGAASIYKEIEGTINHPFVYIADFPLRYTVAGFSKYFTEGVHCVTSKVRQVPNACVPSAAKHRSRLHFHLAQQQAPAGTWPLLTTDCCYPDGPDDEYAEAPGANLVYIQKRHVFTCERNALPGISMQTVKELIPSTPSGGVSGGCLWADELWLTGTPFCMLPVVSLDGKPIGNGKIGPVYKETLAKWSEMVGLDIAQQIIDWDHPKIWTPEKQRHDTASVKTI
jgi:branched-chain amino acid aminotransferase